MDTIRQKAARSITLFGMFNCLLMDPLVRGDLEGSMDGMTRLNLPIQASPYMLGQNIGGIQTQGNIIHFHTDNTLSPLYATGKYTASVEDGAPSTTPTVVAAAAQADSTTAPVPAGRGNPASSWDAASAGNIAWVLTEVVDEREGLGTRYPATGAGFTAVGVGEEVKFTVKTGDALADSVRVYRLDDQTGALDDGSDMLEAYFIWETPGSGDGSNIIFYDNNDIRPNTSMVFGLRLLSRSARDMNAGGLTLAQKNSASYLSNNDTPQNTVAVASLGPQMGILNLAVVLAHVSRPLLYSAYVPEVRNPFQNIVFKNIGLRT